MLLVSVKRYIFLFNQKKKHNIDVVQRLHCLNVIVTGSIPFKGEHIYFTTFIKQNIEFLYLKGTGKFENGVF